MMGLAAIPAIMAVKDISGDVLSTTGAGLDMLGDVAGDVGDSMENQEIANPVAPLVQGAGKLLDVVGKGGKFLGDVIGSDERIKDVVDGIDDVMANLFDEYLRSPAFREAAAEYVGPYVISDFNEKILRDYANKEGPLSEKDLAVVSYIMGKGDGDLDPMESNNWTDDMVQEYAENLRNFLYTYKDSAKVVDPSIDPDEYHRGPMAQDIEKVAPDCVKETEEGVKVVDGNRLALVNAGVIGDLARRLIELEDRVYG